MEDYYEMIKKEDDDDDDDSGGGGEGWLFCVPCLLSLPSLPAFLPYLLLPSR